MRRTHCDYRDTIVWASRLAPEDTPGSPQPTAPRSLLRAPRQICIKYFKDAELPAGLTEAKVEIDPKAKSAMQGKCAQQ